MMTPSTRGSYSVNYQWGSSSTIVFLTLLFVITVGMECASISADDPIHLRHVQKCENSTRLLPTTQRLYEDPCNAVVSKLVLLNDDYSLDCRYMDVNHQFNNAIEAALRRPRCLTELNRGRSPRLYLMIDILIEK